MSPELTTGGSKEAERATPERALEMPEVRPEKSGTEFVSHLILSNCPHAISREKSSHLPTEGDSHARPNCDGERGHNRVPEWGTSRCDLRGVDGNPIVERCVVVFLG